MRNKSVEVDYPDIMIAPPSLRAWPSYIDTLLSTRLLESKKNMAPFKAIEEERLEFVIFIVQFLHEIVPVWPAVFENVEFRSLKIAFARLKTEP